jgi:photosystem II stability/assembly factor-like uncharacterized protein
MKKLSFILIAVMFFTAETFPQWASQTTPTTNILEAISVVNPNLIFAAGDYETILKTTNGGNNWTKIHENISGYDYYGIHFFDENTGIAAGGYFGAYFRGIVSRTTNGGLNWTDSISTTICYRALYFINSTTGFMGGWTTGLTNSPVYKTTNAGLNWIHIPPFNAYGVEDFHFINDNTGWATGDIPGGEGLFKTTDGGNTWTLLSNFGGNVWLCSVFFVNSNTGWVTGNQGSPVWCGLLRKTTDGGLNWVHQTNANNNELYEIQFINENSGWVAGDGPLLQKTTNGGTNWYAQPSLTAWWMWDFHFINENTGWVVGSQGKIYHTINGGDPIFVKNISTEIPSSFSLSQNYPNPFNPETKIQFSIKKTENGKKLDPVRHSRKSGNPEVLLKIYDALGREIETLVNEALQPGTYEVTFNGSRYNSGVYFYRLVTDRYSETKRMLLIK